MNLIAHSAHGDDADLFVHPNADDVSPEVLLCVCRDEWLAAFGGENEMDEVLRVCVCHVGGGRLSSLRDSDFGWHFTRH